MRTPTIRRPSPATAIAILALFVAMGGTAEAVKTQALIHKRDIAHGAVSSKAIAKGAVDAPKLRKGSVTAPKIAAGAVGASALAGGAVTGPALAPGSVTSGSIAAGSVSAGAIDPVTIHTAPLVDRDMVADNGEWTASDTATVSCATGERVLSGGVVFTNPGNREVGVIESAPFTNGSGGWIGRITSNSGGTATAEVEALCLQ